MEHVTDILKQFVQEITDGIKRGDVGEESFYPAFAGMVESLLEEFNKPKLSVTTLPKRTEAGNPDFRIWDGCSKIVGYVEAKNPEVEESIIEFSY